MLENSRPAMLGASSAGIAECLSPQALLRTGQPQLDRPNEQTQADTDRFPYRVFDSTHAIAAFRSGALAEQFIVWCREP